MADSSQIGSDAFRWLDENMIRSADTPDEAFDWVFMLRPDDWPLLEAIWSERPAAWREAFVYILYYGPIMPAQRLLRLGLADSETAVAAQAAISLCSQMLAYPEECPPDISLVPRLMELRRTQTEAVMGEVDEFLRLYGEERGLSR